MSRLAWVSSVTFLFTIPIVAVPESEEDEEEVPIELPIEVPTGAADDDQESLTERI